MPLPPPEIDTRSWRDFMEEALRRNAVHTPEWTNQSDSDPGITLLQLFAFMAESITYRTNNIPERNRRAFLRLLGLGPRPAGVARALVSMSRPSGPLEAVTVAAGAMLAAGRVPFRTTAGIDVLPVEADVFYKRRLSGTALDEARAAYAALYASFADPAAGTGSLDFYETVTMEPPRPGEMGQGLDVATGTVDGLWIALFARRGDTPADARAALRGKVLSLGVMPALDAEGLAALPDGLSGSGTDMLAIDTPNPAAGGTGPAYRPLAAAADANPLTAPARIEVSLGDTALALWDDLEPLEAGTGGYPPDLTDDPRAARLLGWIRIRQKSDATDSAGGQLSFRPAWIGINATRAEQRSPVTAELLRQGSGAPDQTATLSATPVIPASLILRVNGTPWTLTDDLLAAPPEAGGQAPGGDAAAAQVFTLDPATGEIAFGDGLHGARPPRGATLIASYDAGGGPEGLAGIGAIKAGSGLPSGVKVTNPVPSWGGAAAETLEEALRRVPTVLANRDRLVTEADFRTIAAATPGVDMGRVEVLPILRPAAPSLDAPGAVTVMVIPAADPLTPRAPRPDRLFLQEVCAHLAPRRLITTELYVNGPVYVDVWLSLAIEVVPGRDTPSVRNAVTARLQTFLSALEGGFAGTGWPLSTPVDPAELMVRAAQTEGVRRVDQLLFGDASGPLTVPLVLGGLQLPRLAGLSVVAGTDPVPLDTLRGQSPEPEAAARATPVPVIPDYC